MTANEVISMTHRLKPSALGEPDIIFFINELEGDIAINVLKVEFSPITEQTKDADLLATKPYDRLYFEYLSSKVDLLNGNMESYALSGSQFNANYQDFKNYVVRNNLYPVEEVKRTDYF